MKKLLLGLVVLTLLLTVGVPTVGASLVAKKARAERLEQRQGIDDGPAIAAFIADHAALKYHWLMRRHEGGDASAILTPRVTFRGARVERESKLGVPPATAAAIVGYGKDWAAHVDDAPLDGVDVAWMGELSAYGYWDLEAPGSPTNITPWFYPEAPMPDYLSLNTLHKARLLLGLKTGALGPAIAEGRALARLSASTEILVGELVAMVMLNNELHAIEAAKARGIDVATQLADVVIDDDVTIGRLKRACFATQVAYRIDDPAPGLVDKVRICQCSALQETVGMAEIMRPFLSDTYADRYAVMDEALASSPCRLRHAREAAAVGRARTPTENLRRLCTLSAAFSEEGFCSAPAVVTWLPPVREAVGEVLLSISAPDAFSRYREALASTHAAPSSP